MHEPQGKFIPLNIPPQPERQWPVNNALPIGASQPTETSQPEVSQPADTPQATPDTVEPLSPEAEAALLEQLPVILQQDLLARGITSVELRLLDQGEVSQLIQAIVDFIAAEMAQSQQLPSEGIVTLGQIPREKLTAELAKILPNLIESGELGLPITHERSWRAGITSYVDDVIFENQTELLNGRSIDAIVAECLQNISKNMFGGRLYDELERVFKSEQAEDIAKRPMLLSAAKTRGLVLVGLFEKHPDLLRKILTEHLQENWHDTIWSNYANRLASNLMAQHAAMLNLRPRLAETMIPDNQKEALLKAVAQLASNPRLEGEVLMSLEQQTEGRMEFIKTAMQEKIRSWGSGRPDWPVGQPPELAEIP